MRENKKKKIKISLNKILLVIGIIFIIIMLIVVMYFYKYPNKNTYRNGHSITVISNSKNITRGKEIEYKCLYGEYLDYKKCIENTFVRSNRELRRYLKKYDNIKLYGKEFDNIEKNQDVLEYFNDDFFKKHTLAIEAHDGSYAGNNYEVENITLSGNKADINIKNTNYAYGGMFCDSVKFTFIILDKNIKSVKFNIYTYKINNIEDKGSVYKPIIYLYPEEDKEVLVKLKYKDNITVSYPKYIDGWNVLAKKNGKLIDLNTKRTLYSLYYENKNIIDFKIQNNGFVVKGNEVAKFLEEKLDILGLTETEAEEFIIFWLPKLEKNKYNYIRFATLDEINKNMPIEINPKPDNIIRVIMTFKGLEKPIKVEEQKLERTDRKGFTVVEWGGTEIIN